MLDPLKIKKENVMKDVEEHHTEYSSVDKKIKEEIRAYIDSNDLWLTPEAIKKSKFSDSVCSICGQQGCDIKVSYQHLSQMYHKKCFKMFQKKALKYALSKYPKLRK